MFRPGERSPFRIKSLFNVVLAMFSNRSKWPDISPVFFTVTPFPHQFTIWERHSTSCEDLHNNKKRYEFLLFLNHCFWSSYPDTDTLDRVRGGLHLRLDRKPDWKKSWFWNFILHNITKFDRSLGTTAQCRCESAPPGEIKKPEPQQYLFNFLVIFLNTSHQPSGGETFKL